MKRHPVYGLYGEKIVHKGAQVRADGAVSALCFKRPPAINYKVASVSLFHWDSVTCPRCLAKRQPT